MMLTGCGADGQPATVWRRAGDGGDRSSLHRASLPEGSTNPCGRVEGGRTVPHAFSASQFKRASQFKGIASRVDAEPVDYHVAPFNERSALWAVVGPAGAAAGARSAARVHPRPRWCGAPRVGPPESEAAVGVSRHRRPARRVDSGAARRGAAERANIHAGDRPAQAALPAGVRAGDRCCVYWGWYWPPVYDSAHSSRASWCSRTPSTCCSPGRGAIPTRSASVLSRSSSASTCSCGSSRTGSICSS